MANYDFNEAYQIIQSGQPYSIKSVAETWRNFAIACQSAADQLKGTSDTVTAQQGTPYQNFGARATPVASWMNQVAGQATTVANGLAKAGDVGTGAQLEAYQQEAWRNQRYDQISPDGALSTGRIAAMKAADQAAAAKLNPEIDKWSAAYNAFNPGQVAPAPVNNGGSGVGTGTSGSTYSGSTSGAGASNPGANSIATPSPSNTSANSHTSGSTGSDPYPHSSVVGQNGGDFAGWVKDPRTGYLIDPGSGQEYDPTSGRWVDPVTGKPFGDVTQYSSRLEGLTGGDPGSLALGGGGAAVSVAPLFSGGGGLLSGSLFGGAIPPSLNPGNPAYAQLSQTAGNSMAAKAYAANQLAMREAEQGGRPYVPPMQAGGVGAGGGSSARGRARYLTEPESTWTGRAGAARASRGGAAVEAGARTTAAGRSGQGGYVPPMQAGKGEKERSKDGQRPDWLVEDDVWSSGKQAGHGVLGEDS